MQNNTNSFNMQNTGTMNNPFVTGNQFNNANSFQNNGNNQNTNPNQNNTNLPGQTTINSYFLASPLKNNFGSTTNPIRTGPSISGSNPFNVNSGSNNVTGQFNGGGVNKNFPSISTTMGMVNNNNINNNNSNTYNSNTSLINNSNNYNSNSNSKNNN